MTNVHDLYIEKEILPLFDYTQNAFAYESLLRLLNDLPFDVDTILERQQIIKGLLANSEVLRPVAYSKVDLHEAYTFLTSYSNNRLVEKNATELRIHLLLFKPDTQKLSARIIQCILLFHKLNRHYFEPLVLNDFPIEFQALIKNIKTFFSHLNLNKYESIIRSGNFGVNALAETIRLLQHKLSMEDINTFWRNLFLFEAYLSIAIAHKKLNLQFPVFTDSAFSITEFYHPVLKSPVKNSITKHHNVILLTGPNMAGKSTLLKAIGLCVYLGHLGFGVPADACEMPFFDTISIAINPKDDLQSGYSHFLSEIKTLKNVVLEASGKRCFAVFDELFRGTNIEDALEISKTTVQGLTKFTHSFFLISTHLYQLKDFIDHNRVSTCYIECYSQNEQPVFTYKLKEGWSDVKLGQLLFEREGLNILLA